MDVPRCNHRGLKTRYCPTCGRLEKPAVYRQMSCGMNHLRWRKPPFQHNFCPHCGRDLRILERIVPRPMKTGP